MVCKLGVVAALVLFSGAAFAAKTADKTADKPAENTVPLTSTQLDELVWSAMAGSTQIDDFNFYKKFFPHGRHFAEAFTNVVMLARRETPPPAPLLPEEAASNPPFDTDAPWIWIQDRTSHCWAKNRAANPPESISWSGKCRGFKLSGFGMLVWSKSGKVREVAIGHFTQGGLTGRGVTYFAFGETDEGVFNDGLLDGEGEIKNTDGSGRKGTFRGGFLVQGRRTFADGVYDEGRYVNGALEGQAVAVTKDARIEGLFHNNALNGPAAITWSSGTRAEGSFKDGKMAGHFVYHYPNRDIFEAEFVTGERKGPGKFLFADGRRLACVYEGKRSVGDCTYTAANGEMIVGPYVEPVRDLERSQPIDDLYPPIAQRLGETGRVRVRITVRADGTVADAVADQSSGSERLDTAAVQAVSTRYVYHPATVGGHPITMTNYVIIIDWRLH